MDRPLLQVLFVIACLLALSLAEDIQIRDEMKQLENLKDSVSTILREQKEMKKDIEALKAATHLSNTDQNNIKVKDQQTQTSLFNQHSKPEEIAVQNHDAIMTKKPAKPKVGKTNSTPQEIAVQKHDAIVTKKPAKPKGGNTNWGRKIKLSLEDVRASTNLFRKFSSSGRQNIVRDNYFGLHRNANASTEKTTLTGGKGEQNIFGNTSEPLYLVMAKKNKLIRLRLGQGRPVIHTLRFEISSLAYDRTAHSLFWLSKTRRQVGNFDKHYSPKTLWHFVTSPDKFTIDSENRIMYLVTRGRVETINLDNTPLTHVRRRDFKMQIRQLGRHRETRPIAHSRKKSLFLLRDLHAGVLFYEVTQSSKRARTGSFNLEKVVYLQDEEVFLFCDAYQKLASYSPEAIRTKKMEMKCPPNLVRFLHFNGTLCAITKEGVYKANIGNGNMPKEITQLDVAKEMVSPVAELMD